LTRMLDRWSNIVFEHGPLGLCGALPQFSSLTPAAEG